MLTRNFIESVEKTLKDNWDHPCFSNFEAETYSYKEIAKSILIFHEVFKKAGVKTGDKIAVTGKNSVNWAKVYLATVTYGAVIVPILPDFNADDFTNILNHSESKVFFAPAALWKDLDFEKLPDMKAGLDVDSYELINKRDGITEGILKEATEAVAASIGSEVKKEHLDLPKIGNDVMSAILYTSGTTGFSKGVMLTNNCLMANVDFAQNNIELQARDKIVSFLPIAHCFGGAFEFLFPFITGCHITFLSRRVAPQVIMKAFQTVHPRLILSVPLVIEKVYYKQLKPILNKWFAGIPGIKQILGSIMCKKLTETFGGNFIAIVIGGAAFNPEVEAFLKRIGFRFTVGYGMTECGPLISYSPWDKYKGGSSGRIINYLEAKIDSEDPENALGEILVKGENVMLGYYKNEEATREVLSEDGWLHTGDMGVMDKERNVFIKGRCKSMLLSPSGQNIYPEELESKLNNYKIILESVVLDREDRVYGLVYLDQEYIKTENLDKAGIEAELEETRKSINKVLPSYSQIVKLEIHEEEFDKTPKMSIKRFNYK